jgi:hypothetical protein
MKKVICATILLLVLASSCKKTWQCTCTGGASSITITKAYKGEARSECAAWQSQVQDTIQQASCSI